MIAFASTNPDGGRPSWIRWYRERTELNLTIFLRPIIRKFRQVEAVLLSPEPFFTAHCM